MTDQALEQNNPLQGDARYYYKKVKQEVDTILSFITILKMIVFILQHSRVIAHYTTAMYQTMFKFLIKDQVRFIVITDHVVHVGMKLSTEVLVITAGNI